MRYDHAHVIGPDQILALDHLTRHQLVEPGDRVLVLGIGLGLYPLSVVALGPARKVQV
jgi:3-oxoacyl-[acyl-carrier-protein] synthase III